MISGWRLDDDRRTQGESFSGEGARRWGGRWNRAGTSVVYASDSLALAALELFVHADRENREFRLVAYRIAIPKVLEMERVLIEDLPAAWRLDPPPEKTVDLGHRWLSSGRSAVLRVPSAVVPFEENLVLNPAHPDFKRIRVVGREPFSFDPRMWK